MMNVIEQIGKSFNKQAKQYEKAARVQQEIGQRLFERLDYLKIEPKRILDLGCGPGAFTKALQKKYPKAQVVGLDLAFGMLKASQSRQSWFTRWPLVQADLNTMPFPDGAFDLVFANQVIHWGASLPGVFREISRVMNVNGCLMFSTLGPDTFKELKQAWHGVNDYAHVNEFADMHDVGDCLMSERFLEPVMDMELLTMHYKSVKDVMNSLKAQGVVNINPNRPKGLTGKGDFQKFQTQYEAQKTSSGHYPLTYEVVYGHAWKGTQRVLDQGVETFIPVSGILKSKG